MAWWWIVGVWVGVSLLLVIGIAIGSTLGYRRGWEARASMEAREAREPRDPRGTTPRAAGDEVNRGVG